MDFAGLDLLDRESTYVWPCLEETMLGDWTVRFGGGVYGRSNSVQPRGSAGIDVEDAISRCEELYRSRGLPPMFRIPRIGDWRELDQRLEERGYEESELTDVRLSALSALSAGSFEPGVTLAPAYDEAWMAGYFLGSHRGAGRERSVYQLLERVPLPRRFAGISREGRTVAVGLGVIADSTLWLFGMATEEAYRGQGMATAIVNSLFAWAAAEGCQRSALQVLATNEAASRVYDRFGFETIYSYHYRRLV